MYGFEHFGMGWGMVLIWLVPILLVALIIPYLILSANGEENQGELPWKLLRSAMPVVKLTGMSLRNGVTI